MPESVILLLRGAYLVPYISKDDMIETLDTENGIWVWDYEEKDFKLEV